MNILKNFKKKNYNSNPFPFFTINNAFTEKEYSILLSDYKLIINLLKLNKNYSENNIRLQISSEDFLNNDLLKKTSWYDFILFHNSKEFILNLFDIFYEDIIKFYPNLVKAINKKDNQNFNGIRTKNYLNIYEFVSDVQPGINTPVYKKSSVRGPHVDNPVELIGGLFYLREKSDISEGGDLIIHDTNEHEIYFEGKAEVQNLKVLKPILKIPYSANHCVFFLNTLKSVHSITQRSITNFNRNLTNIIIERYIDNNNFFKLKRKKNLINKFLNKIKF
jgi:hypothetical protein